MLSFLIRKNKRVLGTPPDFDQFDMMETSQARTPQREAELAEASTMASPEFSETETNLLYQYRCYFSFIHLYLFQANRFKAEESGHI